MFELPRYKNKFKNTNSSNLYYMYIVFVLNTKVIEMCVNEKPSFKQL